MNTNQTRTLGRLDCKALNKFRSNLSLENGGRRRFKDKKNRYNTFAFLFLSFLYCNEMHSFVFCCTEYFPWYCLFRHFYYLRCNYSDVILCLYSLLCLYWYYLRGAKAFKRSGFYLVMPRLVPFHCLLICVFHWSFFLSSVLHSFIYI